MGCLKRHKFWCHYSESLWAGKEGSELPHQQTSLFKFSVIVDSWESCRQAPGSADPLGNLLGWPSGPDLGHRWMKMQTPLAYGTKTPNTHCHGFVSGEEDFCIEKCQYIQIADLYVWNSKDINFIVTKVTILVKIQKSTNQTIVLRRSDTSIGLPCSWMIHQFFSVTWHRFNMRASWGQRGHPQLVTLVPPPRHKVRWKVQSSVCLTRSFTGVTEATPGRSALMLSSNGCKPSFSALQKYSQSCWSHWAV